jgi:amylosucrase
VTRTVITFREGIVSHIHNMQREAQRSLDRVWPHLEHEFTEHLDSAAWQEFRVRLVRHFPQLFQHLVSLYGDQYDFFYHLERTIALAARNWLARPADLKALDVRREADPFWYQSQKMLAGVCYVDLFAGDLAGLRAQIPYFQELGLTYLHLMPLFKAPASENDGGYAISDYRQVDPALGTMEELRTLAAELCAAGISLVLDFVFNHTSNEHIWAQRAKAGDPDHADYYFIFPDRTVPDAYDRTLREIFPDQHSGSFTYHTDFADGQGRWVWTTFHRFQWDLNYRNPLVFQDMANEMLFLANVGVEILRLDALAFTWKEMGTSCENLPQAHMLVQAFNALARIAAPALLFKSEAIVHPDEVEKYISLQECQLSYNPLLMALLWESLATREVRLLRHSMLRRFSIEAECAWINYVRVHDDIGWTFDDADAAALHINGYDHRQFLNAFYTGRFPGSFARGLPFQENPRTGDARISGTLASLAGLEQALQLDDAEALDLAVRRILLLHAIILSMGGIPLIYLGDEVGQLNDYAFRSDPSKADDNRWVHRPHMDWSKLARRHDASTMEGRIFRGLRHLIELRKGLLALAGHNTQIINIGNEHIFAYLRTHEGHGLLVLANFSEHPQEVAGNELRLYGTSYRFHEHISGESLQIDGGVILEPYQVLWLAPQRAAE